MNWPGVDGLALAYLLVPAFAAAAACWGTIMALKFKTQQAAPLMQVVVFASVLFSTAYAPEALLAPWLETIADLNPARYVLDGIRQGFVCGLTLETTWHALLAVLGLIGVLGLLRAARDAAPRALAASALRTSPSPGPARGRRRPRS